MKFRSIIDKALELSKEIGTDEPLTIKAKLSVEDTNKLIKHLVEIRFEIDETAEARKELKFQIPPVGYLIIEPT